MSMWNCDPKNQVLNESITGGSLKGAKGTDAQGFVPFKPFFRNIIARDRGGRDRPIQESFLCDLDVELSTDDVFVKSGFQRSNYDIRTILNVSGDFGDLCKGVLVKQRGQPQDDGDETVEVGLDEGYERLASLDIQKNK
ncbi:hypothetical protein V6N13_080303 [Hibiscus sabdariffa]